MSEKMGRSLKAQKKTKNMHHNEKKTKHTSEAEDKNKTETEINDVLNDGDESDKYRKKHIECNWTKYDIKMDTYEDIEEKENLGADFEELISMPVSSIGSHFQFKHEKITVNDTPKQHREHFQIDMDTLSLALTALPFYTRNRFSKSLFTAGELANMDCRSCKFQKKYESILIKECQQSDRDLNQITDQQKQQDISLADSVDVEIPAVSKCEIIGDPAVIIEDSISNTQYLNISETCQEHPVTRVPVSLENSAQELEDWLENLLHD